MPQTDVLACSRCAVHRAVGGPTAMHPRPGQKRYRAVSTAAQLAPGPLAPPPPSGWPAHLHRQMRDWRQRRHADEATRASSEGRASLTSSFLSFQAITRSTKSISPRASCSAIGHTCWPHDIMLRAVMRQRTSTSERSAPPISGCAG